MQNNDIWDEIEKRGHGERLSEEMFEFLSAYADGECGPKERRLVEAYLTESAEARQILADLRAQAAMVSEETTDSPAWLRQAILERTASKRRFAWPAIGGLAGAAAAAVVTTLIWSPKPTALPEPAYASRPQAEPSRVLEPALPKSDSAHNVPGSTTPAPTKRPVRTAERFIAAVYSPAPAKEIQPPGPPKATTSARPRTETKPAESATVAYFSGSSSVSKPDATPPDVVALAGSTADEPEKTSLGLRKDGDVLPDSRDKIRERLKKLNEDTKDIKEAVRSN
jgi:anti-sigma factor RsiW